MLRDLDCADVISSFVGSCIPGKFGGDFTQDLPQLCGTQQYVIPDWHLFLCIWYINTPELGLFYLIDTNTVNEDFAFSLRLLENSNPFTFGNVTIGLKRGRVSGYMNGDPVQRLLANGNLGNLSLPQRSLSGQCVTDSPITFQDNFDADCDVTVTSSLCTANSVLDINFYLTNTSIIVGSGTSNVTVSMVNYLCGNFEDYVKRTGGSSASTGESLFAGPGLASPVPLACLTNPTRPTTLTLSDTGSVCNNSVVDVTYVITWNQSSITDVRADIIVANLPYTSVATVPTNVATQSFRVRFEHVSFASATSTASFSGNPGYNNGYPVISGSLNDSGSGINRTDGLRIWQPGRTGLCVDSSLAAPPFGQDILTGCQLKLAISRFSDCAALQQLVEDQQRLLIGSAHYVSRFGNPDLANVDTDWLEVDLSNQSFSVAEPTNVSIPGQCPSIPAHVHVQFITAMTGRILGFPIMEIVGIRVSWIREMWQLRCWESQSCAIGSNITENFFVTSTVSFTAVPPGGTIAPVLADIVDNTTCPRDAKCWDEMWLPLTRVFYQNMPLSMAREEREYSLVWALFLVLCACAFFLSRLHWEEIGRFIKHEFL